MSTPATELQLPAPTQRFEQVFKLAPSGPQLGLVLALATAITLAVGVLMWASKPSMVPLDTRLSGAGVRQAIEQLNAGGHRFEVSDGMLLVPRDMLSELRMLTQVESLIGPDGLGLGDTGESSGAFGMSEEELRQRRIRSLEMELSRTISQIRGINTARVHLAIPRRTAFLRDVRALPSASVKLELTPGRILDEGQVAGIVNLVATSVPHLKPDQVSIVDHNGKLLNRDLQDPMGALTSRQLSYKQHYELSEVSKIEQMLSPIVGDGRVRVQMSASFDFSQVEQQQKSFEAKPESVRSRHRVELKRSDTMNAIGVPGALSNQPPEGGALKPPEDKGEGGSASNYRVEETVNNEVGALTTHTKKAPWRLERLSVAVLVDDVIVVDDAGEVTRKPREQAELDSLKELVERTIGFDESRGDLVSVINRSFLSPVPLEPLPEPKLWEQSWFEPILKTSLSGIALALLVLMVIRPTVRALIGKSQPEEKTPDTDADATQTSSADDDTALLESDRLSLSANPDELLEAPARVHGDILNLAREMAVQDPKRVATVLKKWMDNDE